MPWTPGPIGTLLNATEGASGRSVSISDMMYEGTREVYTPNDVDVGDIVRITGAGTIKVRLDDTTDDPRGNLTLTLATFTCVVGFDLPKKIETETEPYYREAIIPFWYQFLITYRIVEPPSPQHANGRLVIQVNGVIVLCNDIFLVLQREVKRIVKLGKGESQVGKFGEDIDLPIFPKRSTSRCRTSCGYIWLQLVCRSGPEFKHGLQPSLQC